MNGEPRMTRRPRLLMLAAHEPSDDPRVDWAATVAARWFDVEVLGLQVGRDAVAPGEGGYRVTRVRRPATPDAAFVERLAQAALERVGKRAGGGLAVRAGLAAGFVVEVLVRAVAGITAALWTLRPRTSLRLWRQARRTAAASAPVAATVATPAPAPAPVPPAPTLVDHLYVFRATWMHVLTTASAFCRADEYAEQTPQVVYANDLDTLLPAALIAMRTGARLVYDSHEYWPYSNVQAHPLQVRSFLAFERLLIARPDFAMTVSDPLAAELSRVYGRPDIASVPNAEPWVETRGAVTPDPELDRLAAGRVRFLFQGSFAPERGLEELVRAWAGVDHGAAVLFLRGPRNAWRDAIEALAASLGLLGGAVHVLAPVPVDRLVDAAGQADVGIIPYKPDSPAYRYACPNKLSQYMHAGVAILANEIEYVVDQVRRGDCGRTYRAGDAASIVAAVNAMARDPALLRRLRDNAAAYGRSTFNWDVQSAPLQRFLEGAAAGARTA